MSRIITVTSGKGGVGKTNITANLAVQLGTLGHKSCIFDADLGLANINILLDIKPEQTLSDVIRNDIPLADTIIRDCHGIDIIPGSSGIEEIANLEPKHLDHLTTAFSKLDAYDFLFFDTAAGISSDIIAFCLASNEIIMVITPEPTSLTDAYALLKVLSGHGFTGQVRVIINRCKNTTIAKKTYTGFKEVVMKYLSFKVLPLGILLEDPNIPESVRRQQPFVNIFPDTVATKCMNVIIRNLTENISGDLDVPNIQSFWKRCLHNLKSGLGSATDNEQPEDTATDKLMPQISPQPVLSAPKPEAGSEPTETAPVDSTEEKPVAKKTAPPDLRFLMQELVHSITGISGEISRLRQALIENSHSASPPGRKDSVTSAETGPPDKIILDFDAFLKKHNNRKDSL